MIPDLLAAWWRHQMETFSALLTICAGNSPVTGEFPAQRPVARSFDVFFDLRLNKRLNKQSWGWWFETLSCPLWRHCNGRLGKLPTTKIVGEEFPQFIHATLWIQTLSITTPQNDSSIAWGMLHNWKVGRQTTYRRQCEWVQIIHAEINCLKAKHTLRGLNIPGRINIEVSIDLKKVHVILS